MEDTTTETAPVHLPRVAITFCTQCRWMLRAAYFAQELLSTFGGSLGEVALIPATGGLFTVHLTYKPVGEAEGSDVQTQEVLLWDRKAEGGFPETKILKQRVRNHIEPGKDLGHSDKPANKVKSNEEIVKEDEGSTGTAKEEVAVKTEESTVDCADCK
jgi:selT/selW/selH-like putative selenoprotein